MKTLKKIVHAIVVKMTKNTFTNVYMNGLFLSFGVEIIVYFSKKQ